MGAGNTTYSTSVSTDTATTKTEEALYVETHACCKRVKCVLLREQSKDQQGPWGPGHDLWAKLNWQTTPHRGNFCCRMDRPIVETVSHGIVVHNTNRPRIAFLDTEHDIWERVTGVSAPTNIKICVSTCPPGWHQTSGSRHIIPLSCLVTTRMGKYMLEDNVPELTTSEAQPEGERPKPTQMFPIVSHEEMNCTVWNPPWARIFKIQTKSTKNACLWQANLQLNRRMNDSREMTSILGKLGSLYFYDRNRV